MSNCSLANKGEACYISLQLLRANCRLPPPLPNALRYRAPGRAKPLHARLSAATHSPRIPPSRTPSSPQRPPQRNPPLPQRHTPAATAKSAPRHPSGTHTASSRLSHARLPLCSSVAPSPVPAPVSQSRPRPPSCSPRPVPRPTRTPPWMYPGFEASPSLPLSLPLPLPHRRCPDPRPSPSNPDLRL